MSFTMKFVSDKITLNYEFGVSREKYKELQCLFVVISDGKHIGVGEATEFMPDVYQSYIGQMLAQESAVQQLFKQVGLIHPKEFWVDLDQLLPDFPFLKCAIDVAYWDLYARRLGQPLYQVLGLSDQNLPRSNLSIGLAKPEVMLERIQRAPDWAALKLKLGSEDDIEVMRRAREFTNQPFIVDVNCGWTLAEAKQKIPELEKLGVVEIEQPLPADRWQEMKELKAITDIKMTADESCTDLASIDLCSESFDKCNIKLMKSGGISPALELIARARALNMEVMLGCMPESYVGVSAICQLASLLDSIEVDSISMVDNSIAEGVKIDMGTIILNQTPGTSASLLRHPKLYQSLLVENC